MDRSDRIEHPIGLVLVRATQRLGAEPFYQEFIAGVENIFGPADVALLLQVVSSAEEELATYRRWAAAGQVAGVLLVDLSRNDARVDLMIELGIPTVVVGAPETAGPFPDVWTKDAAAVHIAVTEMVALGHRVIGRVGGPQSLAHSQIRSEAFIEATASLEVIGIEVEAGYSEEGGGSATREILDRPNPPTVIIYDDDLMALGGLLAAENAGLSVPGDLSMVAWDDSALCQLSTPKLAALSHDVQAIGELTAQAMLTFRTDGIARRYEAPMVNLVSRESLRRLGPASVR